MFPSLFGEGYDSIKMLSSQQPEQLLARSSLLAQYKSNPWVVLCFVGILVFTKPIAAALTVGSGYAEERSLPAAYDAPGFTPLFNGQDLTGWKGLVGNPKTRAEMAPADREKAQKDADENMREHWKAVDGMLEFDGKGDSLCTARDYGDFELFVDWKILEGGDSGIYLRGSPQVQIWDTNFEKYFVHGAENGSGSLWNNVKNPRFPLTKADKPVGEWNTFFIRMVG